MLYFIRLASIKVSLNSNKTVTKTLSKADNLCLDPWNPSNLIIIARIIVTKGIQMWWCVFVMSALLDLEEPLEAHSGVSHIMENKRLCLRNKVESDS